MIGVRRAVARLEQHALGIPDELRVLAERAGVLDDQRLEPAGQEEPLDVRVGRADERLHEQPLPLDVEADVLRRAGARRRGLLGAIADPPEPVRPEVRRSPASAQGGRPGSASRARGRRRARCGGTGGPASRRRSARRGRRRRAARRPAAPAPPPPRRAGPRRPGARSPTGCRCCEAAGSPALPRELDGVGDDAVVRDADRAAERRGERRGRGADAGRAAERDEPEEEVGEERTAGHHDEREEGRGARHRTDEADSRSLASPAAEGKFSAHPGARSAARAANVGPAGDADELACARALRGFPAAAFATSRNTSPKSRWHVPPLASDSDYRSPRPVRSSKKAFPLRV